MAKLKVPLLALKAYGTLGKLLTIRRRGKDHIAETIPIPKDAKSPAQLIWRHMYQKSIALWKALSKTEQQEWEKLARPKHMTGYAYFISLALKPNPGLYLPLQGGTMQGDIDMGTHKITGLPEPTLDPDAATKLYVDSAVPPTGDTQGRVEIPPWAYSSIGQGTWVFYLGGAIHTGQWAAAMWYNSSSANGDNISYSIYLDAGTYTLCLLHMKTASCAIIDYDIDDVEVFSHDQYAAIDAFNQITFATNISIATAGRKTLKMRVHGRNASAVSWQCNTNWMALIRTA